RELPLRRSHGQWHARESAARAHVDDALRVAEIRQYREAVEHVQRENAFERGDRGEIHVLVALTQHVRIAPQRVELRLVEVHAEIPAAGIEARFPARLVELRVGHRPFATNCAMNSFTGTDSKSLRANTALMVSLCFSLKCAATDASNFCTSSGMPSA